MHGLSIAFILTAGVTQPAPESKAVPVRVSQARTQPVAPRTYVPGTIVSPDDARLASEFSGKLVWVIEPGEHVKEGAAVARLDASRTKLTIEDQSAEVRRLEAMVELRVKDSERQKTLAEGNVGIAADLDRAVADVAMSRQELARAKAQLARSRDELRRTALRAPFNGQVVQRLLQAGEYAREGEPVVRIVNTGRIEIFARVPVNAAGFVKDGDTVPVRRGDERGEARVISIMQTGSFSNRSVTIRFALPSQGPNWLLGSAVSVGVPTSEVKSAVVVPRDAVVLRAGGAHVMVVDKGRAKRVGVELGLGDGAWIAVQGGIEAGTTVVSRGAEGLAEGDTVQILDSPT